MTRKFKNPPLIEAVCEFRFDLENMADSTIPGLIYSRVKDEFPISKQRNLAIPVPNLTFPNQTELVIAPLAQFYNSEESLLIQVGGNFLTINSVKKYPTWENFKPIILKAYRIYLDEIKPKTILRIGIRSINKISIPGDALDLTKHFTFIPNRVTNISTPYSKFNILIETLLNDQRDILIMRNTSLPYSEPGKSSFQLDLEYAMNKPGGVELDIEAVSNWIETSHTELYNAFKSSITEEQLDKFEI